jgi:hypothetical protein
MTRQIPRLILALSIAAISAIPCRAVAPPARNPCPNASELTRRVDILEAVPAEDPAWQEAMRLRGIFKSDDGQWMQHYTGGMATATNASFVAALGDFCAARAVAAAKSKASAKNAPAAEVRPRANEDAAQMTRVKARVLATSASAPSGAVMQGEPETPAADQCPTLCPSVTSCREAGMGGDSGAIDFPCRKAFHDAAAAKCTCS